jgi:hypothetical protein
MITPLLERLILNGKASFNTFVAGGSQKCILNVPNDHFVIITSIQYASALKANNTVLSAPQINGLHKIWNTQLKIFSRKSLNTFLFRDSLNIGATVNDGTAVEKYMITPIGNQKIDTYLVHENDISFTFSYAGVLSNNVVAVTNSQSVGYPPPTDYGKDGQDGVIPVRLISNVVNSVTGFDLQAQGGQLDVFTGVNAVSKECIFPVDVNSNYLAINEPYSYPIVNVNYVLIQGLPNNISST